MKAKLANGNAYTLELPKTYGKLHPTCHISLLKEYFGPFENDDHLLPKLTKFQNDFEIENVLAHRFKDDGNEALVQYKKQDQSENCWVPTDEVPVLLLQEYFAKALETNNIKSQ